MAASQAGSHEKDTELVASEVKQLKEDIKMYKDQMQKVLASENETSKILNHCQAKHEKETKKHTEKIESLKLKLVERDDEIKKLKQQLTSMSVKKNSKGKLTVTTEPEDDKTVTEHQLRAYKRQVDELRQSLENQKEEYESMKQKLEIKAFEANDQLEKERVLLKKMYREWESMKQKLEQEISHYKILYEKSTDENARLRNKSELIYPNVYHQPVTSDGRGSVVQGISPYHQPYINEDHVYLEEDECSRRVDESTRKADEALRELEKTRNQSNTSTPVTCYNDLPPAVVHGQQASHRPVHSDGHLGNYNEHEDNIDPSILYDPNLVCPHCNKQFRYGEIQNLRLHINYECSNRRDHQYN